MSQKASPTTKGFNSLQTGKRIPSQLTNSQLTNSQLVSIPFKRESVSQATNTEDIESVT